jgi:hypothetical protein
MESVFLRDSSIERFILRLLSEVRGIFQVEKESVHGGFLEPEESRILMDLTNFPSRNSDLDRPQALSSGTMNELLG